jgi:nitrogen fixation protein FixH
MMFLAFFGVIFAVNGYMAAAALRTGTGVVAVEPYRKGLAYNQRIEADVRQAALGWTADVSVSKIGVMVVTLAARDGLPIDGRTVRGILGRPSTDRNDRLLQLVETKPGRYEGVFGAVEAGNWVADIDVRDQKSDIDPLFRVRRRLWLAP